MLPAFRCLVCVAILLSLPALSPARTWVVQSDSNGDAPSIQAGIDSAATGDTVLVLPGIYTGESNRNITFLGKAITVRAPAGRDSTTVDAERLGRGFLFTSGEGADSRLEGFTIREGSGGSSHTSDGGGILCFASSPTIVGCRFTECTANDLGGGVHLDSGSAATIEDCEFSDNRARHGGGISMLLSDGIVLNCSFDGDSAENDGGGIRCAGSSATISQCSFTNCAADDHAGGLLLEGESAGTVTDCQFTGNRAKFGGGLSVWFSEPVITNCVLTGCTAREDGGAVRVEGVSAVGESLQVSAYFEDVVMTQGHADRSGGGIFVIEHDAVFVDCRVDSNIAERGGGGIYAKHSSPAFTGLRVVGNTAGLDGGGICLAATGTVSFENGVVSANTSMRSGGGICVTGTAGALIGASTIARNAADSLGGAIHVRAGASAQIDHSIVAFNQDTEAVSCDSGSVTVACSDIFGNTGSDWGGCITAQQDSNGNLTQDPLFCYPAQNDYRLALNSPCLDAAGCGLMGAEDGCGIATDVRSSDPLPRGGFHLQGNEPNPFNPGTTIHFTLSSAAHVLLTVHDISGRRIVTLVDEYAEPQAMSRFWDGRDESGRLVNSGIYFARLSAGPLSATRKLLLVR